MNTMQFPDETLMAYADGEVDADTRRRIEAAMVLDPSIAERIERHRALRADLDAAFGGVLDEPVPPRLLETARSTPASTVTALDTVRASKSGGGKLRKWNWPALTAIAASLVVAVLAGRSTMRPERSSMFETTEGQFVAAGELSAALSDQLSGKTTSAGVRVIVSFRSTDGNYCRGFTVRGGTSGYACRQGGLWRIAMMRGADPSSPGGMRMASTELPPQLLTAMENIMAGDALDLDQERAARERGWSK
ncbi:MAG: hypothetical protein ABW171_10680 [Steroidobacter sp.]